MNAHLILHSRLLLDLLRGKGDGRGPMGTGGLNSRRSVSVVTRSTESSNFSFGTSIFGEEVGF